MVHIHKLFNELKKKLFKIRVQEVLRKTQKIQETIQKEIKKIRANQGEGGKLNYSCETHQRVLPPNIVVKIE